MKSGRKETFFKLPRNAPAITAEALPSIVRQYEEKYGIKVFINGETEFGQARIQAREAEFTKVLREIEDEKTKYAAYLMHFWEHNNSSISISETRMALKFTNREETQQFMNLVSLYLDKYKKFKTDLTVEQLQALNKNLLENFPEIRNVVDGVLEKAKTYIIERQKDTGLSSDDLEEEVRHIQKTLVDNQVVGYFSTYGHRVEASHFEVLIITKDNLCRPADWMRGIPGTIYEIDNKGYFANAKLDPHVSSNAVDLANPDVKKYLAVPKAEASQTECGALGMLYLKELLKEDAKQWREYCLAVPYPGKYESIDYFFLPAPQLLRYSQSSMYNEIIRAMLAEDVSHPVLITRKKGNMQEEHQVQPIKLMLEKTLAFCTGKPHFKKIADECQIMLNQLPEFRKKWLEAFEEAKLKRNDMDDINEINRYLTYKSMRMQNKI